MYTFYNKPNLGNLEEEWKALERIKSRVWKEAFQKGRESKSLDDWKEIEQLLLAYRVAHPGYPASEAEYPTLAHFIVEVRKASYNMGVAWGQSDSLAHEKYQREGFDQGRAAGFAAGFAAAQQQPQAKIEAAYEQGKADAAKLVPVSRPLLRKNGVGY